uniref:Uncharacterized protein n=1 Tax=Aegilops tauschii subsp. strangulata TaxID=200361 RepID=A0A453ST84_AEGTS
MLRCCPSSWSRFHPWFPRPPPRRTNIKHPSRRLDAQTSNIRAAAPTSTNLNDKNGANICIWLSKATPPRRMRRSRQRRRSERSELGISPGEPIRHGVERGSTTTPPMRKMASRCHRCRHQPRSGRSHPQTREWRGCTTRSGHRSAKMAGACSMSQTPWSKPTNLHLASCPPQHLSLRRPKHHHRSWIRAVTARSRHHSSLPARTSNIEPEAAAPASSTPSAAAMEPCTRWTDRRSQIRPSPTKSSPPHPPPPHNRRHSPTGDARGRRAGSCRPPLRIAPPATGSGAAGRSSHRKRAEQRRRPRRRHHHAGFARRWPPAAAAAGEEQVEGAAGGGGPSRRPCRLS